jgi:hypothetical protein
MRSLGGFSERCDTAGFPGIFFHSDAAPIVAGPQPG